MLDARSSVAQLATRYAWFAEHEAAGRCAAVARADMHGTWLHWGLGG